MGDGDAFANCQTRQGQRADWGVWILDRGNDDLVFAAVSGWTSWKIGRDSTFKNDGRA